MRCTMPVLYIPNRQNLLLSAEHHRMDQENESNTKTGSVCFFVEAYKACLSFLLKLSTKSKNQHLIRFCVSLLQLAQSALDCLADGLHCSCLIFAITYQIDLGAGLDTCCHYV